MDDNNSQRNDFSDNYIKILGANAFLDYLANNNLDKDKNKRKIIFPDGTTIIFQNNSIDKIRLICKTIHEYIDDSDFDSLGKIKKYYISSWENMFVGTMEKDVPDQDTVKEKEAVDLLDLFNNHLNQPVIVYNTANQSHSQRMPVAVMSPVRI
jgi:hypothetical protein